MRSRDAWHVCCVAHTCPFVPSCFLPLLRKSVRRSLFFFCVLWFVSPPSCFFFLAASSITYLSALRFPYREGVEGGFVFFFFQHTCCTLCRFLLPSPIEKACVCLWVGRGWGCIP